MDVTGPNECHYPDDHDIRLSREMISDIDQGSAVIIVIIIIVIRRR